MNSWELQKHNTPQLPDPNDKDQYTINIKLVKIVHQLWLKVSEAENRIAILEAEMAELKSISRHTRPPIRYSLLNRNNE